MGGVLKLKIYFAEGMDRETEGGEQRNATKVGGDFCGVLLRVYRTGKSVPGVI